MGTIQKHTEVYSVWRRPPHTLATVRVANGVWYVEVLTPYSIEGPFDEAMQAEALLQLLGFERNTD